MAHDTTTVWWDEEPFDELDDTTEGNLLQRLARSPMVQFLVYSGAVALVVAGGLGKVATISRRRRGKARVKLNKKVVIDSSCGCVLEAEQQDQGELFDSTTVRRR